MVFNSSVKCISRTFLPFDLSDSTNGTHQLAFSTNPNNSPAAPYTTGVTTTGADATVYLAKTITVPADTTLVLLDTPIYLMEGDVLKGGASANSDLDMFVSFEILDDA